MRKTSDDAVVKSLGTNTVPVLYQFRWSRLKSLVKKMQYWDKKYPETEGNVKVMSIG
jgi:hypothetical protein